MGKAWLEHSPEAAQTFGAADEILGDALGEKLSTLCFEGPADVLNRTDVAQPAIFVASIASYQALFADHTPETLSAVAGLSLGEYTALYLAGVFTFEDALRLVSLRGKAMQEAAESAQSTMLALIGADEEEANAICEAARQGDVLVPANFNAPGQIVLAGSVEACARAAEVAGEKGKRAIPLSVAGAFHSPFMAPAAERLGQALASVEIHAPRCTVLSNVTAVPHCSGPDEGKPADEAIAQRLVEQLTAPVRWAQCNAWLVARGEGAYHELAPGKVLAGLMKKTDRKTKVETHDTP